MSKYLIKQLHRTIENEYTRWQNGLKNFNGTTIFHNPDFLSYHQNKFKEHHIGIYKGEALLGVMPMALIEENKYVIAKSPYGASYGGPVFTKPLSYKDSTNIVKNLISYLRSLRVNEVIITPSLDIFHKNYSDTFILALLENNFINVNSDITSIATLKSKNIEQYNSRSTRICKKSVLSDFNIVHNANIDHFWVLMDKTFEKHGTAPTHTKKEFKELHKLFPKDIYASIIYKGKTPLAGIGTINITKQCCISFYICQNDEYKELNAQTILINNLMDKAYEEKFLYFDFGTSSVEMVARENIFEFKEGFGSSGKFRHSYKLEM